MKKLRPVNVAMSKELIDWIDSRLETPYGRLRRSDVVRHVMEAAMKEDKKRPE